MTPLDIGIHHGFPPGWYHQIPAASASALREIHGATPAHLKHRRESIDAPTIDMVFGTLVHQRILEPAKPLPALAIVPETYIVPADYRGGPRDPKPGDVEPWNWRRKYCQQWRDTQEAAGFIVIAQDKLDEIEQAAESLLRNRHAADMLAQCDTEVTMLWETMDGHRCKARLDAMPRDLSVPILDIKTTTDASPSGFAKSAWDNGYHLQAAWYLDGALALHGQFAGFTFLAYEKGVGLWSVHNASREFIDAGREAYADAFARYVDATESGIWRGYGDDPVVLDPPAWTMRRRA